MESESLWTIEQASDYLGVKIHTLYIWTHRGSKNNFPFLKAGHLLRFRQSDIDAWLQRKADAPQPFLSPVKPRSRAKSRKGRDSNIDAIIERAKAEALEEVSHV
jgi:excisionase family DNA binding protein